MLHVLSGVTLVDSPQSLPGEGRVDPEFRGADGDDGV